MHTQRTHVCLGMGAGTAAALGVGGGLVGGMLIGSALGMIPSSVPFIINCPPSPVRSFIARALSLPLPSAPPPNTQQYTHV